MKIVSYNVRGLGSSAKRRIIRELLVKEQIDMMCVQETKLESVDVGDCTQMWRDSELEWKALPVVNKGGGLLCIWKRDTFHLLECVLGHGFIGLVGTWGDMSETSAIVNIYSSCRLEEKRAMWRELVEWKNRSPISLWCLGGDFNSVRAEEERRGVATNIGSQRRDIAEFNRFIEEMELLDLPLSGRKYTWYRPNGQAQSRIDRFLLSPEWLANWPHSAQIGFDSFVQKTWEENQITGWGAYRLKEKLKGLKVKLKSWNREVFRDLRTRREATILQINDLDSKEEELGLSEEEINLRKTVTA
ncbi:uncharacterized protein LOC130712288 [Lotus japonicus]|uniref:uncharacterized protein LOC130712288 n=1 Tax=Lotus japonicus TaxID=34305 RepID=UPI00258BC6F5|nr:uncharacterized protein LOC130712288 [Lotus japonicus]